MKYSRYIQDYVENKICHQIIISKNFLQSFITKHSDHKEHSKYIYVVKIVYSVTSC